jgi:hypothetical protein
MPSSPPRSAALPTSTRKPSGPRPAPPSQPTNTSFAAMDDQQTSLDSSTSASSSTLASSPKDQDQVMGDALEPPPYDEDIPPEFIDLEEKKRTHDVPPHLDPSLFSDDVTSRYFPPPPTPAPLAPPLAYPPPSADLSQSRPPPAQPHSSYANQYTGSNNPFSSAMQHPQAESRHVEFADPNQNDYDGGWREDSWEPLYDVNHPSRTDHGLPYEPIVQDVSSPRQFYPTPIRDLTHLNQNSPTQWSMTNNDSPPPLLLTAGDDLAPQVTQVGPGVLPVALLEKPLWPASLDAREVEIKAVPAPPPPKAIEDAPVLSTSAWSSSKMPQTESPTSTTSLLPPSPIRPTASLSASSISSQQTFVSATSQPRSPSPSPQAQLSTSSAVPPNRGPSPSPSTLSLNLPPPPTLEEIRASLPQPRLPSGEATAGSVTFDPTTFAWWVFKTGTGVPDEAELSAVGTARVDEFIGLVPPRNKTERNFDDEEKLARHYHLVQGGGGEYGQQKEGILQPRFVEVVPTVRQRPASEMNISRPASPPPPSSANDQDAVPTADLISVDPPTPSTESQPSMALPSSVSTYIIPSPLSSNAPLPSPTPSRAPTMDQQRPASPPLQLIHDDLWLSANTNHYLIMPQGPACKGILDPELVRNFIHTRSLEPPPGKDGVVEAFSCILTCVTSTHLCFSPMTERPRHR